MRIISGKYKGHHLVSFDADHIRPTTDRVKETIFNKFMTVVDGSRVLDLFCGTGSLGLESLSRGALECHFVDDSKKSLQILTQNLQKLKIESSVYSISQREVLHFLKKYNDPPFDLILIDPPFTQKMAQEVMEALSLSSVFHAETLIAIESQKKEPMKDQFGQLCRYDLKDYGDKILSFFSVSSDKDQE